MCYNVVMRGVIMRKLFTVLILLAASSFCGAYVSQNTDGSVVAYGNWGDKDCQRYRAVIDKEGGFTLEVGGVSADAAFVKLVQHSWDILHIDKRHSENRAHGGSDNLGIVDVRGALAQDDSRNSGALSAS